VQSTRLRTTSQVKERYLFVRATAKANPLDLIRAVISRSRRLAGTVVAVFTPLRVRGFCSGLLVDVE
jgi:hypothetical protein